MIADAQFAKLQEVVNRMAQSVHVHEQQLRPVRGAQIINRTQADKLFGPAAMRVQLGAGGVAPLSLHGLKGASAETQAANVPTVPALPELGDTSVKVGTLLQNAGVVYRRDQNAWTPLVGNGVASTAVAQPSAGGSGGSAGSSTYNGPTTQVIYTAGTALVPGTIYGVATSGKPTWITVSVAFTVAGSVQVLCDTASSPVTPVTGVVTGVLNEIKTVTFLVLPGYYFAVVQISGTIALPISTEWC